ncbi:hypothetical protein [Herbidospora mongoliensis]|uniref:hypothetical protein n=1 Tax=Herbidospora mongoliensis TaxID=688067 RepID=UPI00083766EE|nr:hypothetical protein [Herbidospora mongoliensis]
MRLVRSAAFAAVCVVLAAVGHQAAGGNGPTLWALGVGMLGVFAGAYALAGHERSHGVIAGVLVAVQALLHELFTEGQTARVLIGPLPDPDHGHGGLGVSLGMVLAHLTASLIAAWWLARGEAALWAVLRRLGVGAWRILKTPTAPSLPRQVRVRASAVLPSSVRPLRHAVIRRGPPLAGI